MADDWAGHTERINKALAIYRPEMRRYITDTLDAEDPDWYGKYLERQLGDKSLPGSPRRIFQRYLREVKRGDRIPRKHLEASEFRGIVDAHRNHFPSQLITHAPRMESVARVRNYSQHQEEDVVREDADHVIHDCAAILSVFNERAAQRIRKPRRAEFVLNRLAELSSDIWVRGKRFFLGLRRREREGRSLQGEAADPGSTGEVVQSGPTSGGGGSSATTQILTPPPFQPGSSGGDGAFAAGGEVDEREPVQGRRRLSVGRAILVAVILVGLAVAIGFAIPGLLSSDGESTSEPATADPGGQTSQEEPSAQTPQPAPEQNPEKNDPPVPPDDPDPEPIEQDEAKLPPPEVPISFSAGAGHSCRLTDDGAAVCWGRNNHGQINAPDGRFTAISAGGAHTCGLRADGSAECWGWNEQRQIDAPGEEQFASIAAGWRHTCGITVSKAVKCWGWNEYRQSADRDGQFSQVSAGFYHTCAVRLDGGVECWGRPGHERTQPPAGSFATVSASQDHTCGLRADDRRVECWGGGAAGGSTSPPKGSFSAISAGQFHNCGILTSGAVQCWGSNDYRQRDDAPAGDDFTQLDAGARHTCAMRTNGEVVCWGDNSEGQGNLDSAVTEDHIRQGSDPPPPPRPECDFTDDEGNCVEPPRPECDFIDDEGECQTDGEEGTSGSGSNGQNGVGAGDDDLESDSHQAEPPGDGTIDPESDAMDDDDGSGLQPGALQEEEPGTTIVTAEDNPIIVIPAQESADGDVMEDDE